jgi:hypothetical protein
MSGSNLGSILTPNLGFEENNFFSFFFEKNKNSAFSTLDIKILTPGPLEVFKSQRVWYNLFSVLRIHVAKMWFKK